MKIRYQLLIILLALAIAPQLILNQLYNDKFEQQLLVQVQQAADYEGVSLKQLFNDTLKDNEQLVSSMVKNIQFAFDKNGVINQEAMNLLLRVSQESTGDRPNFFIGTESGHMYIYPESQLPAGYDPRVRNWYIQADLNKTSTYWDGPYIDQGTKQLVITVSKYFKYEQTEGVMGIDVVLSNLRDALKNKEIAQYGETFLVDKLGNIVIHNNPSMEGYNIKYSKYAKEGLRAELVEGVIDGKDDKFIIKQLTDELFSVTVIKRSLLSQALSAKLWRMRAMPLLFTFVTAVIAFWLSKSVTEPLRKLTEAFLREDIGKQIIHVPDHYSGELGQLNKAFNRMTDHLLATNEEMSALYEELTASEETLQEQYDELRANRDQIMASELRYRTIFDMSNEGLWEVNTKKELKCHTPNWFRPFFSHYDHISDTVWLDLIHPEEREKIIASVRAHLNGETPYIHEIYRVRDLQGVYHTIETKAKKMRDEHGLKDFNLVGSHLDISERRRNEDEILKMAYFDSVTELPNRQNFERELSRALSAHDFGTIVYLDIVGFKTINETYGYAFGDLLLKDLTKRLQSEFAGHFCARIAGDEFAVLIEGHIEEQNLSQIMSQFEPNQCCTIYDEEQAVQYQLHLVACKFPNEGKTVEEVYATMMSKIKTQKSARETNVFVNVPSDSAIIDRE